MDALVEDHARLRTPVERRRVSSINNPLSSKATAFSIAAIIGSDASDDSINENIENTDYNVNTDNNENNIDGITGKSVSRDLSDFNESKLSIIGE